MRVNLQPRLAGSRRKRGPYRTSSFRFGQLHALQVYAWGSAEAVRVACERKVTGVQVEELEKHLIQISRYGVLAFRTLRKCFLLLQYQVGPAWALLHYNVRGHECEPCVQATLISCVLPSAAQIATFACFHTCLLPGKIRYAGDLKLYSALHGMYRAAAANIVFIGESVELLPGCPRKCC